MSFRVFFYYFALKKKFSHHFCEFHTENIDILMLKLSKIIFEFFDRSQEQILTYTIEQDLVKKKQDPVQLFIYRKKNNLRSPGPK